MKNFTQSSDDALERDRILTLAVLNFLAIENIRDATELINLFRKVFLYILFYIIELC